MAITDYPTYPSYLPMPHFTSSGLKQTPNLLRSEMASGYARQRRQYYTVPAEQTLQWRLSPKDADDFLGWVEHALFGGARWFYINQRTESGVQKMAIRMQQHPLENRTEKGGQYFYKVKCEIKQYPVQSEEQAANRSLYPHTLDEFVIGVGDVVDLIYTNSWES
jgi:hypothetical protein